MPLADAFVSNDVAVKLIDEDVIPSRDLGGVQVKSIDTIKLAQLFAMLSGKTFLESLPQFTEIHAVSDDGPWVYRFPPGLQTMLAALTAAGLAEMAAEWAQIPEFELDRIKPPAVAALLRSLADLARQAESDGDRLYLWNCL